MRQFQILGKDDVKWCRQSQLGIHWNTIVWWIFTFINNTSLHTYSIPSVLINCRGRYCIAIVTTVDTDKRLSCFWKDQSLLIYKKLIIQLRVHFLGGSWGGGGTPRFLDLRLFGFVMRTEMKYLKMDSLAILQYWHKPPPNPHKTGTDFCKERG